MATSGLRKELECSVCLSIYTEPVSPRCGHSFYQVCIGCVLNTQEEYGGYSCHDSRTKYKMRPALQRNIAPCNVVENVRSTRPDQQGNQIFCSQCIDCSVPAVKYCLHCEVSLCENHLRVHSKAPHHVLCDPTANLESRKCSIHNELLKYYSTVDAVCVSCSLTGEHQGHQVETLNEDSEKKKEKPRNGLQKLITEKNEAKKRVQTLRVRKRKAQHKVDAEKERVFVLFIDFRRSLDNLERKVLSGIAKHACTYDKVIRQLKAKKYKLSRKMRHIEELCKRTDPLTVTNDLYDPEERDNKDRKTHDEDLHDGGDVDQMLVLHTIHTGLFHLIEGVNECFNMQEAADLLLDRNTANNNMHVSDDRKTASWSSNQNHPETPERFQHVPQVLSRQCFTSGRHYWDMGVEGLEWRVGMCYPSIHRRGEQSEIGHNNKSWCLQPYSGSWFHRLVYTLTGKNRYAKSQSTNKIQLPDTISSNKVRIYLDYEAGRISFYDLCDPIRHLHTFTATFTEPLHVAIYVYRGHVQICGGN